MIQGMISAWITTEYGLALPELDVKHAEGRVDCWIPSIQGTNFCINWHSLNPSSFGLRGDIWLDGVAVGGGLLMPNETRGIKMTGHSTGNASERPYHFGKQQLTDDDTVSSPDDPRLAELNTIRLVLDWVYVTEERRSHLSNAPASLGPIHEKAAKKAHGDSAGLGALRPSTARQWFNTQSIGMKKTVLVFHYAPEEWLLAKKIITAPLDLKPQSTSRALHSYLAKTEKDKKRQVPDRIDWFGPSSSGSSSRSALSQTTLGRSTPLPISPANHKRPRRTETPELHIYDGDEDSVEEILASSSPAKRPRNEVKYETFNHPVGSFVNGEVIDLTGEDSD